MRLPHSVSGTFGGEFNRKQTGKSDWHEAKALVASWEAASSWDGIIALPPPPEPTPVATPGRITIADAVKVFLSNREGSKIALATLRKYKTFTKQLVTFADGRGYVMLDQFASADIDLFYSNWKLGPRAKGKALGTLRSFFRFCAKRKWIAVDATDPKSIGPVSSDLRPPNGANRVANKAPFTDEELQCACPLR